MHNAARTKAVILEARKVPRQESCIIKADHLDFCSPQSVLSLNLMYPDMAHERLQSDIAADAPKKIKM